MATEATSADVQKPNTEWAPPPIVHGATAGGARFDENGVPITDG